MCLGIPGRLLDRDESTGLPMGTVDFAGVRKQVCLAYVPEVQVGEYVIVHVGFAISQVDEAEAARTFAVLQAMGDALALELGTAPAPATDPGPGPAPATAAPVAPRPAPGGGAAR